MATETSPFGRSPFDRRGVGVLMPPIAEPRTDGVIAPSPEDVEAANAGALAPGRTRSFIESLSRSWAVRLGLVGVGGYAAYQNVPAFQEFADQTYHDTMQKLGLEVFVPTAFNNNTDKGVIGARNATPVTQREIDRLYPNAFERLNDGKNTILLQHLLDLSTSSNPDKSINFRKTFGGANKAERDKYAGTGIYDGIIYENVPGGAILRSPVDGFLVITRDEQYNGKPLPNGADVMGVLVDFVAPNGNHYRLNIGGSTTKNFIDRYASTKTPYVFNSLIPTAPSYDNNDIADYGFQIHKGDLMLKLIQTPNSQTIEEVNMNILVARVGKVGDPINSLESPVPTNIQLLTDPKTDKILIPAN